MSGFPLRVLDRNAQKFKVRVSLSFVELVDLSLPSAEPEISGSEG
jgi:hypothetical protein